MMESAQRVRIVSSVSGGNVGGRSSFMGTEKYRAQRRRSWLDHCALSADAPKFSRHVPSIGPLWGVTHF